MSKMTIPVAEGGGWEPLPEGDYAFVIESVEQKTSNNGNPQLMLKMRVLEGPHADKTCTNFLTITAKSAFRTKQVLEAAAVETTPLGKDADGNELFDFESDDLMGKTLIFKVGQREYEGKLNNDFNKPRAYGMSAAAAKVAQAQKAAAAPNTAQGAAPPAGARPAQGYPGAASPPVDRRPRG